MNIDKKMLTETHRNARAMIEGEFNWRGCLCSNNHNLQFLMYFEAFRQTAYMMITDGGPGLAIELIEKVIAEMLEAKKLYKKHPFDETKFLRSQDRARKIGDWDIFMDIPFSGELPSEDEED